MACVTYGCPPIEDHEQAVCGEVIKGGQDQIILFTCDAELADPDLDIYDASAVNAAIATDIGTGKAVIAKELNITMDAGSPVEFGTQAVAGRPNGQITTDYSVSVIDSNVTQQNDAFWDAASAVSGRAWGGFIIRHVKSNGKAHYVLPDNGLYARVSKAFPADTDIVHYAAELVFKSVKLPKVITSPAVFQ